MPANDLMIQIYIHFQRDVIHITEVEVQLCELPDFIRHFNAILTLVENGFVVFVSRDGFECVCAMSYRKNSQMKE